MTGRIEKSVFIRYCRMNLPWAYSIITLVIMLAACNPVVAATQTTASAIRTEVPPISSTPVISTPITSSTATEEIYPTYTPAPTSTAIATLQPRQPLILAHIHMSDEKNGWGIDAGEHIVHTADGGHTWKDVTPRNGAYKDSGFFALDANTAWATSYQYGCYTDICSPAPNNATVWHTLDGGNTWQEQHVCLQSQECGFDFDVLPGYYYPIAIHFVGAQTGWLLITVEHLMFQDRYRIYQTTNGGTHWSPLIDNIRGPWVMSVTGLAFQDQQTGWFTTSQIDGATDPIADWSIYQSTDAGRTWTTFQLPEPAPLPKTFAGNTAWCGASEVNMIPPNTLGVTIGCRVYTKPWSLYDFYFHSPDGGKHWNSWLKTGDVDFLDSLVGWRSTLNQDAYNLEQTLDGGQTWSKLKTMQWNGDLEFVSEQTGWAIATTGNTVALVHTTDGGKIWEEIKPVVAAP
jgi:photosystem II stability/assembly factor-like uncharacterized protein